ncbi:MAG: hypothetical protein V1787_06110 [Candidatus Micrarchaeota archaeon]
MATPRLHLKLIKGQRFLFPTAGAGKPGKTLKEGKDGRGKKVPSSSARNLQVTFFKSPRQIQGMRILLAGFERWGPYRTNPAEQVVRALHGAKIAGAEVVGVVLPVDFRRLPGVLRSAIEKNRPDAVLTMGLSFRKLDRILIETRARRVIRPLFPDNNGRYPNDARRPAHYDVTEGRQGPQVRQSTLPVLRIQDALASAGIPVHVSRMAGGHMCEQMLYLGPHFMEELGLRGLAGHIHLPHSPSEAKDAKSTKSMPLPQIRRAVRIAVRETVAEARLIRHAER